MTVRAHACCEDAHPPTHCSLQLHFLRLPSNIAASHVVLMDATVATGAAAIMAIRVLLVRLLAPLVPHMPAVASYSRRTSCYHYH